GGGRTVRLKILKRTKTNRDRPIEHISVTVFSPNVFDDDDDSYNRFLSRLHMKPTTVVEARLCLQQIFAGYLMVPLHDPQLRTESLKLYYRLKSGRDSCALPILTFGFSLIKKNPQKG
ncbi:hypothetical protein IGI04_030922, partial [Brassica rapa subsp. trilocularis]